MKKLQFALISFIIISSISCGSTPVSQDSSSKPSAPKAENVKEEELPGLYFKNQQTKEKLRIDNWKYMGFDNSLPSWVIPALEGRNDAIKNSVEELKNSDIKVLMVTGQNSDQAEKAMHDLAKPEGYKLYDSFWIRVNPAKGKKQLENNYVSIAVYYKLNEES